MRKIMVTNFTKPNAETHRRFSRSGKERQRGEQWAEDERAGGRVATGQRQRHHGCQVG